MQKFNNIRPVNFRVIDTLFSNKVMGEFEMPRAAQKFFDNRVGYAKTAWVLQEKAPTGEWISVMSVWR